MPRDPKKINSYVFIDFETSGLDKKDGLHAQRVSVTEVAALAIDGTTLEEIVRYDEIVQPYDQKHEWQDGAAKLTGLYKPKCINEGLPIKDVVKNLCQVFNEANLHNSRVAKPILVAHNWPFDRQFLQYIFKFCEVDLSQYVDGDKDAISGEFIPSGLDTIDWAKNLFAPLTENTTKFNLGACCERAGVQLADGHRAMHDVVALKDLFIYYSTRLRSGSSEVTVNDGVAKVNHRNRFEW